MDKGNEKVLVNGKLINKYMDLKHTYDIVVPKSPEFNDSLYENDIFDKEGNINDNYLKMTFNEVVFAYMDDRLFRIINLKMNKIIEMYEEEYVDPDEVPDLLKLVEETIMGNDDEEFLKYANEFFKLVQYAYKNNTMVGFLF